MRIIADHVRSSLMLMSDGVTPGNEGRGYILRRLMRRSIRAMRLLGVEEPTFAELFPASRDAMKAAYPDVATEFGRIERLALAEEDSFLRTLANGTAILDVAVAKAKESGTGQLPSDTTFLLHDTFGFPIDLTLEIAEEAGSHHRPRRVRRPAAGPARDGEGRRQVEEEAARRRQRVRRFPRQGRDGVHRLRRARDPDHGARHHRRRRVGGSCDRRADRRGDPRRDLAVRRVRRPGGRRRADRRRRVRPRGARRAAPGQGAHQPHRAGHLRRGRRRAMPRARWSMRSGGAARPRRTRRPTSSTRRCGRSSGRRRTSPARTTRPATCASTSAGASRSRRRRRPRSRRSPTTPCATTSR